MIEIRYVPTERHILEDILWRHITTKLERVASHCLIVCQFCCCRHSALS